MTGECLYPQLTAKARAATSGESRIRAPFARPAELRDGLGPLRSLAVGDVQPADGGGGWFYLGLSEAEIAATLGISPGTVKSTAARGLATLADALKETR